MLHHRLALGGAALALVLIATAPAAPARAAAAGTFAATGGMTADRVGATATLLANGEVLVAGGESTTADLYNPATGTFGATGTMITGRFEDTATLLANGEVLIAGGGSATAELYNPATGTFAATGSMSTDRLAATATLLANGEVLIAGGANDNLTTLSSAELYNPATGTFSATGGMTAPRQGQSATVLSNGTVLVAGGGQDSGGNSQESSAELYNPTTGTFTATGSMSSPRQGHSATLLSNGSVLVIGQENLFPEASTDFETYAELYNPATGTWSDASTGLSTCNPQYWCRYESRAVLLGSGNVLVAGGFFGSISAYSSGSVASAVLYHPATNSWTSTGAMTNPRSNYTATVLPGGQVLVAGGTNYHHPGHGTGAEGPLASAELYTP